MAKARAYEGTPEQIVKLISKLPKSHQYKVTISPDERQKEEVQERTSFARTLAAMSNRTPQQIADAQARAVKEYPPHRTVPAGMTLADIVCGKWPGNETDEQIATALDELS